MLLWTAAAHADASFTASMVGAATGQTTAREAMYACMMGTPVTDKELQEARGPAEQVLLSYFALAQAGKDRSPAFHLDGRTRWTTSQISARAADINQPGDMLAVAGNRVDASAGRFFRSSRFPSALGQWPVRDARGALAGVYTALFDRKEGVWKLRSLDIATPGERIAPVSAFCEEPGDVLTFRSRKAKARLDSAEARFASAQNAWTKAEADAATRENEASEKPASPTRADAASRARAAAREWVNRVNERQQDLRQAQAEEVRMMQATVALQPAVAAALFGR